MPVMADFEFHMCQFRTFCVCVAHLQMFAMRACSLRYVWCECNAFSANIYTNSFLVTQLHLINCTAKQQKKILNTSDYLKVLFPCIDADVN